MSTPITERKFLMIVKGIFDEYEKRIQRIRKAHGKVTKMLKNIEFMKRLGDKIEYFVDDNGMVGYEHHKKEIGFSQYEEEGEENEEILDSSSET